METLIKTILTDNHYVPDEAINGYHQNNNSYFFIKTIVSDELEEIKSKSLLDEQTWYLQFLTEFKEKSNDSNYSALSKNSSLIILVNSSNISDIERLQSQILLIEEDQFFVKKYVIVYTTNALAKISELTTNEQLQNAVINRVAFQNVLANGFNQNQEDYVLLLQLFIKLPFLTLKFNEDQFVTLPEKLNTALGNDYSIYQQLFREHVELREIDFLSIENEDDITNLLTLLTNDPN